MTLEAIAPMGVTMPLSACPPRHLIQKARAEHHGDDRGQLHHTTGQHPQVPP
jgi:hypothetical protein